MMSAMKIKLVPIEKDLISQEAEQQGVTLKEFAAMAAAIAAALTVSLIVWKKLFK